MNNAIVLIDKAQEDVGLADCGVADDHYLGVIVIDLILIVFFSFEIHLELIIKGASKQSGNKYPGAYPPSPSQTLLPCRCQNQPQKRRLE